MAIREGETLPETSDRTPLRMEADAPNPLRLQSSEPHPTDSSLEETSVLPEETSTSGREMLHLDCLGFHSKIDKRRLKKLLKSFQPPKNLSYRWPAPEDSACSPTMPGVVTVYEAALSSGLRFPLARPIREVLARLSLNPAQLLPNSWKILVGCAVIWKAATSENLSTDEFLYCYRVVESGRGWYYFGARSKEFNLVDGYPSSIKHWKDHFFFMYENG